MKSMVNFLMGWAVSVLGGLFTGKELWREHTLKLNRILRRFESSAAHEFTSVL